MQRDMPHLLATNQIAQLELNALRVNGSQKAEAVVQYREPHFSRGTST
jgi:hypothetical protein